MSVDIRVQAVKPLRNTFAHIARRFGDKAATRYQEATYDLQSEVNHHYKPLWDPDRELYDKRRTAVAMKDWYDLKDPRQYYYGSYTIARARQQEALDRQMEFAERRQLLFSLPDGAREAIIFALVPLRHYEWGANTNMSYVSAYGYGTCITQAATMATMDRLGMAQHLSRIGLMIDGNTGDALERARHLWTSHADWQPLRREMEAMFVTRDWFELLVAQALVADGLIYPLFLRQFEAWLSQRHGVGLATVLDFQYRWYEETVRWIDTVVKTAVSENMDNKRFIQEWTAKWRAAVLAAITPVTQGVMGIDAASAIHTVTQEFNARVAKLGIAAA